MRETSFTVSENDAGTRLDAFLARTLACGTRGAKRLVITGAVLVNGKNRPAHYKLPSGAHVTVLRENRSAPSLMESIRLVAANAEYAAFFKPAGVHTASLAGSATPSLETFLREHWAAVRGALTHSDPPTLLSRLDCATSGLVAAAFFPEAIKRFRRMEAEGMVEKLYLAVVRGVIKTPLVIRNGLDTANRKKTRVLHTESPDETRHTEALPSEETFCPSDRGPGDVPCPATVLEVRIRRGARHQIRAHLAHAGFPILGDTVYGMREDPFPLHLHHARLTFPGFSAFCPPPWFSLYPETLISPCV